MRQLFIFISFIFIFAHASAVAANDIVELRVVQQVCSDTKHDTRHPNKSPQKQKCITLLRDGCCLYLEGSDNEVDILLYSETGKLLYETATVLPNKEGIWIPESVIEETYRVVVLCSNAKYEVYLNH